MANERASDLGRQIQELAKQVQDLMARFHTIDEMIRGDGSAAKPGLRSETSGLRADVETLMKFRNEAIRLCVLIGVASIAGNLLGGFAFKLFERFLGGQP